MNRQYTSRRMFGLIMLTATLLLVACGSGDGDANPTATSGANAAVPTLPVDEATAAVMATEDISEEDLTVVTPDLPATTAIIGTPADIDAASLTSSPVGTATGLIGTPAGLMASASPSATAGSTPGGSGSNAVSATPGTPTGDIAATPAPALTEGGSFDTPGDGTGGSGQPGERSSNVPGEATPVASPVASLTVEGCDVPTVPAFTGSTASYVTVAEVNFRSGPGTDCTPILEQPLAEGMAVTVLGGPVAQSADGSQWLQIEVDGVPGWVTTEFVEPAE